MEERFALRLPPDLAVLVREIAEIEKRSVNRQMELFLEGAVRRWQQERGQPGARPHAASHREGSDH